MKPWMRKFVGVIGVTAGAVTIPVAVAPSAHADSAYGCNYPEVCFYTDTHVQSAIVARFKVVTSSWQYLQYPNTNYAVVNTRNDDVAYVLNSSGTVNCVKPNGSYSSAERVVAVRISSRSTC
ncbi:hypothetical protein [Streptomyces sp. NBC_00258]|uniref:hypothetical protein n=1 Tax=Streptomyces sp. NBC_00258 TaxID=2903642 RepID=UPI002E2BDBA4|nr:hypothetical protein [Streptomyces sp. NBC_00258]